MGRKPRDPDKPKAPYNLRAQICGALRTVFFRHPLQQVVRKRERIERVKINKTGKQGKRPSVFYKCAQCGEEFKGTEIQVDHIEPVVALTGFVDWNTYIERLFCDPDNLQISCRACHTAKTKGEMAERARIRAERRKGA